MISPSADTTGARGFCFIGATMKLVVKVKKPEKEEAKPKKMNSKQRKVKAWHDSLHAEGLRQYRFVWPLGTVERLLGGHTNKKANDYVLELVEREIASRSKE